MYKILRSHINNLLLLPIIIISCIFAIPFTFFLLIFGFNYVIRLNTTIVNKLNGLFMCLIIGLPFYYCLSYFIIFDFLKVNLYIL